MRFFETLFAGAALVAAAAALEINNFPSTVESGKTYTLTYSPADDTPTTFILRQGANADLSTVTTLTTSATAGKFEWTVSPDLPDASDYAFQIKQGTTVNYIGPVGLTGSDATSSISSSAAPSTTAAPSTSASVSTITSASLTSTSIASVSITSSAGLNSTISSATLSTSTSTGTSTPSSSLTSADGAPVSTGAAAVLGASPMTAMFGAIVAMVYFN